MYESERIVPAPLAIPLLPVNILVSERKASVIAHPFGLPAQEGQHQRQSHRVLVRLPKGCPFEG